LCVWKQTISVITINYYKISYRKDAKFCGGRIDRYSRCWSYPITRLWRPSRQRPLAGRREPQLRHWYWTAAWRSGRIPRRRWTTWRPPGRWVRVRRHTIWTRTIWENQTFYPHHLLQRRKNSLAVWSLEDNSEEHFSD